MPKKVEAIQELKRKIEQSEQELWMLKFNLRILQGKIKIPSSLNEK